MEIEDLDCLVQTQKLPQSAEKIQEATMKSVITVSTSSPVSSNQRQPVFSSIQTQKPQDQTTLRSKSLMSNSICKNTQTITEYDENENHRSNTTTPQNIIEEMNSMEGATPKKISITHGSQSLFNTKSSKTSSDPVSAYQSQTYYNCIYFDDQKRMSYASNTNSQFAMPRPLKKGTIRVGKSQVAIKKPKTKSRLKSGLILSKEYDHANDQQRGQEKHKQIVRNLALFSEVLTYNKYNPVQPQKLYYPQCNQKTALINKTVSRTNINFATPRSKLEHKQSLIKVHSASLQMIHDYQKYKMANQELADLAQETLSRASQSRATTADVPQANRVRTRSALTKELAQKDGLHNIKFGRGETKIFEDDQVSSNSKLESVTLQSLRSESVGKVTSEDFNPDLELNKSESKVKLTGREQSSPYNDKTGSKRSHIRRNFKTEASFNKPSVFIEQRDGDMRPPYYKEPQLIEGVVAKEGQAKKFTINVAYFGGVQQARAEQEKASEISVVGSKLKSSYSQPWIKSRQIPSKTSYTSTRAVAWPPSEVQSKQIAYANKAIKSLKKRTARTQVPPSPAAELAITSVRSHNKEVQNVDLRSKASETQSNRFEGTSFGGGLTKQGSTSYNCLYSVPNYGLEFPLHNSRRNLVVDPSNIDEQWPSPEMKNKKINSINPGDKSAIQKPMKRLMLNKEVTVINSMKDLNKSHVSHDGQTFHKYRAIDLQLKAPVSNKSYLYSRIPHFRTKD